MRSYSWSHQLLTDDDRRSYMYDGHVNIFQQNRSTTAESITRYDAYGNKVESSNVNDVPFGYCGEYLDSESGLIYLRNRYYYSESGRFISEDPIRDGVNWYAYCAGNPVAFVDPFGLTNFVAIRDWYDAKKAYCEEQYGNTVGILDWDPQNKTTSIMLMANGYGGYAEFKAGIDGTYIDSDANKMYVDEQLLWSTFGKAIDSPVQVNLFSDTATLASFLVVAIKAPTIISSTKKSVNTYSASSFITAENLE